jgi:hypothetical protein
MIEKLIEPYLTEAMKLQSLHTMPRYHMDTGELEWVWLSVKAKEQYELLMSEVHLLKQQWYSAQALAKSCLPEKPGILLEQMRLDADAQIVQHEDYWTWSLPIKT